MAYDEDLADRIRISLEAQHLTAREIKMFGGLSFMLNEHMLVAVFTAGALLVRCDPARDESLLTRDGAKRPVMGTKTMGAGWIAVAPEAIETDADFDFWMDEAIGYNRKHQKAH